MNRIEQQLNRLIKLNILMPRKMKLSYKAQPFIPQSTTAATNNNNDSIYKAIAQSIHSTSTATSITPVSVPPTATATNIKSTESILNELRPIVSNTSPQRWPNQKQQNNNNNNGSNILCSFCNLSGHSLKACNDYITARSHCSRDNYLSASGQIRSMDLLGFAAAGIMPYKINPTTGEKLILLCSEYRKDVLRYNFIGGKRDFGAETPQSTASRELIEELTQEKINSNILSTATIAALGSAGEGLLNYSVFWSYNCKYLLFPFELPIDDWDIDSKFQSTVNGEIHSIKWFNINELIEETKLAPIGGGSIHSNNKSSSNINNTGILFPFACEFIRGIESEFIINQLPVKQQSNNTVKNNIYRNWTKQNGLGQGLLSFGRIQSSSQSQYQSSSSINSNNANLNTSSSSAKSNSNSNNSINSQSINLIQQSSLESDIIQSISTLSITDTDTDIDTDRKTTK